MAKLLLYVSDWELSAYVQDRHGLSRPSVFHESHAGRVELSAYLRDNPGMATYLLTDLAEEDFQHEVMPHVSGKTRNAMIGRRVSQLYRDTPFRRGVVQGREAGGRKDDQILFSALTNPSLPGAWLDVLLDCEVPLAGMFSLALMGEALRKSLHLSNAALLLITHQSGGLRQSFFHHGRLLFSRLTPLYASGPNIFSEAVMLEVGKTRQFLASTRQLAREDPLQVAIMGGGANLDPLTTLCRDSDSTQYRLITIDAAARQLGLGQLGWQSLCDPLFLALLARKTPASHYLAHEQRRLYLLGRARTALHAVSGMSFVAAFAWSGINMMAGWEQYRQIRDVGAETRAVSAEYRAVLRSMPATSVSAHDMKVAVGIGKLLQENVADPAPIITMLSHALRGLPRVSLVRLEWGASENRANAAASAQSGNVTAFSAGLVGLPRKPEQAVKVDGEIIPFNGDFRQALQDVQALAAALRTNPQLRVQILRLPINITPAGKLEGAAGGPQHENKAGFSLKVIWAP